MERITVMGIDLAKNVFELCGRDASGGIVLKRQIRRKQLREFVAKLSPGLIGMEACPGSHYWAREFRNMGHEVRWMSPQFVKPYVKSNKSDTAAAEAISEAVTRPTMRFVGIKTVEQQDLLGLHRIRERLIRNRTALMNQIRGLVGEYGIVVAVGEPSLRRELPRFLEDAECGLTPKGREWMAQLYEELKEVAERIEQYEKQIGMEFSSSEICQRLSKVPGVGPITSTAIVATVGDAHVFRKGRELSAWLGLVPRQHSTGGKPRLLGISKRGDKYVRKLLVHGARAVLQRVGEKSDRQSQWLRKLQATRGTNKACVALANKNARILWALMASGQEYRKSAA